MSKEDFNNALNHIDYDLIEEYVEEKERLQRRTAQKRAFMRFVPIAACFVIIITFSITLLPTLFKENSDFVGNTTAPIEENIDDTPEGDENNPENPEGNEDNVGNESEGMIPGGDQSSGDSGMPPYGKPGDDWQTPDATEGLIFVFTFEYGGKEYVLDFMSEDAESFLEELEYKKTSEDNKGEQIGSVTVMNHYNGTQMTCPIYDCIIVQPEYSGVGKKDGILIELYEGYYLFVSAKTIEN